MGRDKTVKPWAELLLMENHFYYTAIYFDWQAILFTHTKGIEWAINFVHNITIGLKWKIVKVPGLILAWMCWIFGLRGVLVF